MSADDHADNPYADVPLAKLRFERLGVGASSLPSGADVTALCGVVAQLDGLVRAGAPARASRKRKDGLRYEIYTGVAGVAFAYFACWQRLPTLSAAAAAALPWTRGELEQLTEQYLSRAQRMLDKLAAAKRRQLTFLTGASGLLALDVACRASFRAGERRDALPSLLQQLLAAEPPADASAAVDNELFYGRAGYLFALRFAALYARRALTADDSGPLARELQRVDAATQRTEQTVFRLGSEHALRSRAPMMYAWHGKMYVGAAHGLAGIVYLLLNSADASLARHQRLLAAVQFITALRLPSGNYPSREDSHADRLVQFCHGATGVALVQLEAACAFAAADLRAAAQQSAEVVWRRGLLAKGVGLCHGVAGGVVLFLKMYHHTADVTWLARALAFVDWTAAKPADHPIWTKPDQPWCLYNGAAGMLVAVVETLAVLANPATLPTWPALDLPNTTPALDLPST